MLEDNNIDLETNIETSEIEIDTQIVEMGPQGKTGPKGERGIPGISPKMSYERKGKKSIITIEDVEGIKKIELQDGQDGSGTGDMLKAIYDCDDDGIVDNAAKVNNHTVEKDVPEDAIFTDTIYDDTEIKNKIGNLEQLETITKSDLVSAINEARTTGNGQEEKLIVNTLISKRDNGTYTFTNSTDLKNAITEAQKGKDVEVWAEVYGLKIKAFIEYETILVPYVESVGVASRKLFLQIRPSSGSVTEFITHNGVITGNNMAYLLNRPLFQPGNSYKYGDFVRVYNSNLQADVVYVITDINLIENTQIDELNTSNSVKMFTYYRAAATFDTNIDNLYSRILENSKKVEIKIKSLPNENDISELIEQRLNGFTYEVVEEWEE